MGPELIILLSFVALCWVAGWVVLWRVPVCDGPPGNADVPVGTSPGNADVLVGTSSHADEDVGVPKAVGVRSDVAIVIPARNEAANLPILLQSIRSQSMQPAELIVVDDGSTDGTADVARSHGARVVTADPPPPGWRGKTWPAATGAAASTAAHLMFVDADTWFEPGGLARILDAYAAGNGAAVSVCPFHAVPTIAEQFSAIFNLVMAAGVGSFARVPDRRGAFGQMLLVSREAYTRAGGHAAVKDRTLETVWLGRALHAAGTNILGFGGRGALTMRMYPAGLRALTAGWAKGFAAGAGVTPPGRMALIVSWLSGGVTATGLLAAPERMAVLLASIGYVAYAVQYAIQLRRLGSYRLVTALLFPIPLAFFFAVFLFATVRPKRNVRWKGRTFDAR